MRVHRAFLIKNINHFKHQLLQWSLKEQHIVWLDSNDHDQKYADHSGLLALGAEKLLQTSYHGAFEAFKGFYDEVNDWVLGYLSYDLKNDIEALHSNNQDSLHFPELYFIQPKKLFLIKGNRLNISYLEDYADQILDDFEEIRNTVISQNNQPTDDVKIKLRIHKDAYFEKVQSMLDHIKRGDIYEANFCQEFYAEDTVIRPYDTFKRLNTISRAPFSSFIKLEHQYVISASPERFLKKNGPKVISQPIKGTAGRAANSEVDLRLKKSLESDPKERSENIMIVDLVRNDLSKIAVKGSVNVEELCKVYTFEQVHQMISTVSAKVIDNTHPVDIIRAMFPMGSMTGAPKISAMKIIEELEESKRGVYSGAIGYITPNGDFDFNVVIRSILYNQAKKYLSYSVGGAITAKSDPIKEYEECLIKAKAMRSVLEDPMIGNATQDGA